MKCRDAHKQIHLFTELTNLERDQVVAHINECQECRELFESAQRMNNIVRRAAGVVAEPIDSFKLTNRIMERVRGPHQQSTSVIELVSSSLESKSVKWVLATISLVLISTWAIELMPAPLNSSRYSVLPNKFIGGTILDRKIFQDELNKHKESERFKRYNSCKDPFRAAQYTIECLKEAYSFQKYSKRRS